jgi:hypothetical protein
MISDSVSLFEGIQHSLKMWREKVSSRNIFKDQWHAYILTTRQLIKSIVEIEEDFCSDINIADKSSYSTVSDFYQKKVSEIIPIVKVIDHNFQMY